MSRAVPPSPHSVAVVHLGRNGGGPKFTFELARSLAGEGIRVSSVIASGADNRDRFDEVGPVLALSTFGSAKGALLRSPLAIVGAVRALRFVRQQRADVVVVAMEQIWQTPMMWALRAAGVPTLLCVHDASMHPGDANLLERGLRWSQRAAASGFVSFSEHVAQVLESRWRGRPIVRSVHGAFAAAAGPRRRPSTTDRPVVGFFGRLSAYKGLGLGYEAVQRLRESGTPVVFRVVANGDDPALAGMRHADDELVIGWTRDTDVPDVLAGFDVLLLPYTEASQSGVLAYALGAALPSVVTPVGGLVEQAEESGAAVVAAAATPEALEVSLRRVLQDDLHGELADAAVRAAEGAYSWSRVAGDVLRGARTLLEPRPSAVVLAERAGV